MTIGERIQKKRKEAGLSQEELGAKLNVSRQAVYKWENDQSLPEMNNLIAMAKILNVSQVQVSRIEKRALAQLHEMLR